MYSAPTFITFLFFSQLAPASPVPAEAQAPLIEHQPQARSAEDAAVIAQNSPQYVINKMEPDYNVTCKASDTACVMGKSGPSQKRDTKSTEAVPEYLEASLDKRQYASNGIQAATQNAGINSLQRPAVSNPSNSTNTTTASGANNGTCKGSDSQCVMGTRDAIPESDAEANYDPIAIRIAELQTELEDIRSKRDQLAKREAMPAAKTTTTSTSTTAAPTITMTATLSKNSTSTTTTGYPRSTNAFGRIVCKASDVECVTGATR